MDDQLEERRVRLQVLEMLYHKMGTVSFKYTLEEINLDLLNKHFKNAMELIDGEIR